MAHEYRVKITHNVLLINTIPMAPQPRSGGVQFGRRTYAVDGSVHDENPYIDLIWDMFEDEDDYMALLVDFGLAVATSAAVTVVVPNQFYQMTRYNGTAIRPEGGSWNRQFIRDVIIRVNNLEAL